MADAALQRKNMVESQVRPSDVTDRRITAAMQELPRERFVPETLASLAYMDEMLPLGNGRSMMAPRTLARLIQLASVEDGGKVLLVGALAGYSAAVLARLGGKVTALESDTKLADAAGDCLRGLDIASVSVVTGPLNQGFAGSAPYDVIFIEGAIEQVPQALLDQLGDSGRIIAVELGGDRVGRAVTIRKLAGNAVLRHAFDATAALLPGFEKPAAFKF